MMIADSLRNLSDAELLARVRHAVEHERHATAALIALLMELDARRLFLAQGCSSLFTYCTQVLHLSEHAAYGRIEAARIARKFPVVLERIQDGSLNLTTVCLLGPHLTTEHHISLLEEARHRTKREVEQIVVALSPKPDVAPTVRKVPAPRPITTALVSLDKIESSVAQAAPSLLTASALQARPPVKPAAVIQPLGPERYKLQLTISRETRDKLRRVQDLLRHSIPNGDLERIVERALTLLLEEAERIKYASTTRPRASSGTVSVSRHVPAGVKRAVWLRDKGQCTLRGTEGRCRETGFLEFHHVVPYASGGETSVANLQLRCRAHNQYEAQHLEIR